MVTPLQTAIAIAQAAENIKQLTIDLKQVLWSQSAAAEAVRPTIGAAGDLQRDALDRSHALQH